MATKKTETTQETTTQQPAHTHWIEVTTRRDGFRRAGRAWTGTTTLNTAELSAEHIDQLMSEPLLHVRVLGDAPASPDAAQA